MVHLQERRDSLLLLKPRWANSLASIVRFDSHVADAQRIAVELTTSPAPVLQWQVPQIVHDREVDSDDDNGEADSDVEVLEVVEPLFSGDLADILEPDELRFQEGTDAMTHVTTALFDWTLPVCILSYRSWFPMTNLSSS